MITRQCPPAIIQTFVRMTRCKTPNALVVCLTGLGLCLAGCGETSAPTADVILPQVWAQPAGGVFDQLPESVTLASTKEAMIYYTLDGSRPTDTSAAYNAPLTLPPSDVVLRFVARDASGNTSLEQVERYRRVPGAPQVTLQTASPVILGPQQRTTIQWVCVWHCGHFRVTAGVGGEGPELLLASGMAKEGQAMQTTIDAARLPAPAVRLWVQVSSNEGVPGAASLPLVIDRQPPQVRAWPAGGTYSQLSGITLVTDEAATVYYTTDGSAPTGDAPVYTAPIRLDGDTTLRFLAQDQFGNAAPVQTEVYRLRKHAPTVQLQQFPGFRLDVRTQLRVTWRSSQRGRYLLSANDQPLLRGRVERNKPIHSMVIGWSLKTPHNRLRLSVTDEAGNEGSTSWLLDTVFVETFANAAAIDEESTTAAQDMEAGRMALPTGPLQAGFYETRYTSRGVASHGHYAYLANTRGGLHVLDLATPETPRLAGTFFMHGEPKALAKYDRYVYLAADTSGVQIFDVSRPQAPVLVGHQRLPGRASALTIAGTRAYIGTHDQGLYVYDLTDPRHPTQVAHVPLTMPVMHIAVTAAHVYVAGFAGGVAIVDISTPTAPTLLTTFKPDPYAETVLGVAVQDDRLYVAADSLTVFNVQNAAQPRRLTRLALRSAYGLAIVDERIYVADQYEGIHIVDSGAPQPRLLGTYDTANRAVRLDLEDDIAFVADVVGGLQIIDVSQPDRPMLLRSLPKLGQIVDVQVEDGFAYLANRRGQARLLVVDVRHPGEARVVGSYRNGSLTDVVLSGPLVYTLDAYGGLQVLDVDTPQRPVLLGAERIHGVAQGLALSGSHAVVAAGAAGLQLIDVSDPSQPSTVSRVPLAGESADVTIWGDYVYVATGTAGIVVLDITQPKMPRQLGAVPPPTDDEDVKVVRVAVAGPYLYASTTEPELAIFSLAAPQQPQLLSRLPSPEGTLWALAPHGRRLYATTILKRLVIVDVTDPSQPRLIGSAAGGARDLALGPPYLLHATESYKRRGGGLRVLEIYAPLAPRWQATGLSEAFAVAAAGPYLYTAAGSNGLIVGQSDATSHVQRLGHFVWQDTARQLALCGPRAYVGGQQAIAVVDITTLPTPKLRSTLALDTPVADLACTDTLLAVAEASGLRLIDASQHQRTVPVPGGLRRVAWWGEHYLLGLGETGRLTLFDLTNPTTPRVQWHLDVTASLGDFALYGRHAYVAAGAAGVLQIPLQHTAASQPHTVWNGEVLALTIWGRQALLLDRHQGLVRLDLSDPTAPQPLDTVSVQGDITIGLRLYATPTALFLARGQHGLQAAPLALSRTTVRVPQALVQSRKVDTATLAIASATLWAQAWTGPYGHLTYALSNNGGDTWEHVFSGVPHRFTTAGSDLRWRAVLHGHAQGANPALYTVRLTYELATPRPE